VFGGRASKALGSVVTNTFKKPVTNLMFYGSIVSISIAFALVLITSALGRAFERFTASGELVGLEGSAHSVDEIQSLSADVDESGDDNDDDERRLR